VAKAKSKTTRGTSRGVKAPYTSTELRELYIAPLAEVIRQLDYICRRMDELDMEVVRTYSGGFTTPLKVLRDKQCELEGILHNETIRQRQQDYEKAVKAAIIKKKKNRKEPK